MKTKMTRSAYFAWSALILVVGWSIFGLLLGDAVTAPTSFLFLTNALMACLIFVAMGAFIVLIGMNNDFQYKERKSDRTRY